MADDTGGARLLRKHLELTDAGALDGIRERSGTMTRFKMATVARVLKSVEPDPDTDQDDVTEPAKPAGEARFKKRKDADKDRATDDDDLSEPVQKALRQISDSLPDARKRGEELALHRFRKSLCDLEGPEILDFARMVGARTALTPQMPPPTLEEALAHGERVVKAATGGGQGSRILKALGKTGGEGTRGGHVIGHTRSGKPVYGPSHAAYKHPGGDEHSEEHVRSMHEHYPGFTADDHEDAQALHMKAGNNAATWAHGAGHEEAYYGEKTRQVLEEAQARVQHRRGG